VTDFQQWLAACETAGGCKYDIVAYHYYGKDANDLIKYSKVCTRFTARLS
jgi:hypothetical protein